jgi:hypothetical protein
MRRQLMFLAMAAAVAVGASACEDDLTGGGGEQPPATPSSPSPAGSGETSPAPAQPPAGGVLASRELQDDGHDLLLEITGLQRQGQTLSLAFRITSVAASEPGAEWYMGQSLGDGVNDYTVSGVTIVDPANAQRYLVARSGGEDGECACSQGTNIWFSEGDTVEFFASYAVPPPDVTTVNVEFPMFGVFNNVAIS